MYSKGRTRLNTGSKCRSLQDACRLFCLEILLPDTDGHVQANGPLSAYVVMRLLPSSNPLQISMFWSDIGDLPGDSTTCLVLIP
ncbi:hypothetical protein TNCV_72641 [Trichonephila clavipes]|uniref:Uncharacterized protein n=1 Tax=Trichonephila clavipes TaxID=2585209 RepID=A0A8X6RD71_TRICX|nr:hypothetical protein TNCV_72641 [Trichonephila clavipes]